MASDTAELTTTTTNGKAPPAASRGDDLDCFVLPDEERLHLAPPFDRYWVEVKRELTVWERDQVTTAMLKSVKNADGEPEVGIDTARGRFVKLKMWLTDWNLVDRTGKRVNPTTDALRNLRPALADAIMDAIDAHVQKMADVLDAQKKAAATPS